jgi:hypothetical protein
MKITIQKKDFNVCSSRNKKTEFAKLLFYGFFFSKLERQMPRKKRKFKKNVSKS